MNEINNTLQGLNILVEGETGTGKTYSLGTIADAGIPLFCLFTENGLESLAGYWTDKGRPIPPNVHWHVLPRPKGSFKVLADSATKVNTYSSESLHKMQDPDRAKHNQFITLLTALSDFPDDRTGKKFGAVDEWGTDRVLAIDSLSGINPIAMSLVVGGKPVRSQQDWGIAQDQIEKLMRQLTDGCKCHFVMLSHIEREIDPIQGGTKITVATLGRALAPRIPPLFSDVILSYREGKDFLWSTANPQAALKSRNLAIADGIKPDFKQIFDKWQSRGGQLLPSTAPVTK